MRPATSSATHVDRADDVAPRELRRRIGVRTAHRQLFRFQLLADFSADPDQVGPRRDRIAPAERQAHAGLDLFADRDAFTRGVQPDDVAHPGVDTELPGTADQFQRATVAGVEHADERPAHRLECLLRSFQAHPGFSEQGLQGRFSIELEHHVVIRLGHRMDPAQRLAALGDPRLQLHALTESNARKAAAKNTAGATLAADVAVASNGELHCGIATGGQAAEQVSGGRAVGHFGHQLGDIGCLCICVQQGRMGFETTGGERSQGRDTRKDPVLIGRQFAQHDAERGFVQIFRVVDRDAHTDGARPIGDFR